MDSDSVTSPGLPYVNELITIGSSTKRNINESQSPEWEPQYPLTGAKRKENDRPVPVVTKESLTKTQKSNVDECSNTARSSTTNNITLTRNSAENASEINQTLSQNVSNKRNVAVTVIEPETDVEPLAQKNREETGLFDDDGEEFSAPTINFNALDTPEKTRHHRSAEAPKRNLANAEKAACQTVSQKTNRKRNISETVEKSMGHYVKLSHNQTVSPLKKKSKITNAVVTTKSIVTYSDSDAESNISGGTKRPKVSSSENKSMSTSQVDDGDIVFSEYEDNASPRIKIEPQDKGMRSGPLELTQELLTKARNLIVKKEESDDPIVSRSPLAASIFNSPCPSPEAETEDDSRSQKSYRGSGNVTIDNAQNYIDRVLEILDKLKKLINSKKDEASVERTKTWLEVIEDLYNYTSLPETIIAVIGNTGAGKSSLLNALLDYFDILPTSGMKACTAAVVEVNSNNKDDLYRADIEFLSPKEWYDELELLLTELTGADGRVRFRRPPPETEAGIAFNKIYAVYGQFDTGVKLNFFENKRKIHDMLGTVKVIKEVKPNSFKRKLEMFVEARDTSNGNGGGQFWPLVKQVKLYLPNCAVVKTGAKLVDLPGVRDSNAARDKIARDFIKKCTAVWVVADITRAVDDKTARDLLGEHFRRQLLMDGQYGALSFVCTKTDALKASEIRRALPSKTSECEELEKDIELLEEETENLRKEGRQFEEDKKTMQTKLQQAEEELPDLQETIDQLEKGLQNPHNPEDFPIAEYADALEKTKDKRNERVSEIENLPNQVKDLTFKIKDHESKIQAIDKDITKKRRTINAICSKARSNYSKSQLKRDFKAGMRAMKRLAGVNAEDDDDDGIIDDYDSDDDDENIRNTADNLKVFCVSSGDFLKMRFPKESKDGPPVCFNTYEETGIPKLRNFVKDLTSVRHLQATEKLIERLAQSICDMQAYLTDTGTKDGTLRNSCKICISKCIEELEKQVVGEKLHKLQQDIDRIFEEQLNEKIIKGAGNAKVKAEVIATKWGERQNKEKPKEGGYHFSTYKATVRRDGQFKSPAFGPIDFNEDLTEPMMSVLSINWERVFSDELWRLLDEFMKSTISQIQGFGKKLASEVVALGIPHNRINKINQQVTSTARQKLADVISVLKDSITEKQREISRMVTPLIQQYMLSAYQKASGEGGTGCFTRMKDHVTSHTAAKKKVMFHSASQSLKNKLMKLQDDIMTKLQEIIAFIMKVVTSMYEPFWEAPAQLKLMQKAYREGVHKVLDSVKELCQDADLKDTNSIFSVIPVKDTSNSEARSQLKSSIGGSTKSKRKSSSGKQSSAAAAAAQLRQISEELAAEGKEMYGTVSADDRMKGNVSTIREQSSKPPTKDKASNEYVGVKTYSTSANPFARRETDYSDFRIIRNLNPNNYQLDIYDMPLSTHDSSERGWNADKPTVEQINSNRFNRNLESSAPSGVFSTGMYSQSSSSSWRSDESMPAFNWRSNENMPAFSWNAERFVPVQRNASSTISWQSSTSGSSSMQLPPLESVKEEPNSPARPRKTILQYELIDSSEDSD